MEIRTGGSRGAGTPLRLDLAFVADKAVQSALMFEAHGLQEHDKALWLVAGLRHVLQYAKAGHTPTAWFYPVAPLPARTRALSGYLAVLGRVFGFALPRPAFLDLREPGRMARWLAERARAGRPVCLTTYGSSVARICAAARDDGLDLAGVAFVAIGEPYTEARRHIVARAGAAAVPAYAFNEAGTLGFACREPQLPDDVHLLSNAYGLVQRRRPVGDGGVAVDAFLVTSLLATGPKVLLNAESGDYGTVTRRSCPCLFGELGLTTHLGGIRSFEKLTTEGMTFVKTDLLHILEEILPSRFGGGSSDYQLVEEPRGAGLSRLTLLVSPQVEGIDPDRLRRAFLEALGRDGWSGKLMAGAWDRADAVAVRRAHPYATKAGKILPFHLIARDVEQ
jgi:antitoxin (DNA-binding transcriptional repressor) of toxin-antitoxin stability system